MPVNVLSESQRKVSESALSSSHKKLEYNITSEDMTDAELIFQLKNMAKLDTLDADEGGNIISMISKKENRTCRENLQNRTSKSK